MVVVEDITMEPHIMERHIMGAMEVVKFVKKKHFLKPSASHNVNVCHHQEVGEVVTMVEAMAGVVINLLPRHLRLPSHI